MARKLYDFADHPDHKARLTEYRDRWIANAMSTAMMTDDDREACRRAVVGLYQAANLKPPPLERIVFVPSPLVMRLAGGFAAAIWHARKTGKKPAATRAATGAATGDATRDATWAATRDATWAATGDATRAATGAATGDATRDATWAATRDATWAATGDAAGDATWAATRDATWAATRDATRAAAGDATRAATGAATGDATRDATWAATRDATWAATGDATRAATGDASPLRAGKAWHTADIEMIRAVAGEIGVGQFGLMCAANADNMWDGGNQWSYAPAYLSFFREVAELPIDWSKWDHYQALAERSGPRIMHAEFCIISDRPEVLKVDAENRPHCDDGPFCRWRDGFALYSIHGVRVSQQIVEAPETLTFAEVRDEPNAEVRRHMLERFGGLYRPDRHGDALQAWIKAGGLKPISSEDITAKMQPSGLSIWRLAHGDKPVTCDLYRATLSDDEPLHLLTVVCTSTAKLVPLRVPPTIRNAAEARAWTFRGASLAEDVET